MSIHRIVPAALAAGFALITTIPADAKPTAKPPKVKPATAHATTVKATSHGPKTTVKPTTGSVKTHGAQAKAVKPTQAKGSTKMTTTTGKAKTKTSVDLASGSSGKVKGNKSNRTARNVDTAGSVDTARNVDTAGDVDGARPGSRPDVDTAPTTGSRQQLSKAQQHLLKNDHLRAKMAARLGGNIDPVVAAAGFKNLGQFVAAVNVSNNQGIAFKDLRLLMLGDAKLSLGQAIQQLKGGPIGTANATADTAIATANRDLAASADVNTTSTKQKAKRNDRS